MSATKTKNSELKIADPETAEPEATETRQDAATASLALQLDCRPRPGALGPHTQRALELLRAGQPGDVITIPEMTAAVGRDCGSKGIGRGNVAGAIRICRKIHRIAWQWSRAQQAWVCLVPGQHTEVAEKMLGSVRKRAIVVRQVTDCADLDGLTPQQRQRTVSVAIVASLISDGATARIIDAVEKMPSIPSHIDEKKLLEFFRS